MNCIFWFQYAIVPYCCTAKLAAILKKQVKRIQVGRRTTGGLSHIAVYITLGKVCFESFLHYITFPSERVKCASTHNADLHGSAAAVAGAIAATAAEPLPPRSRAKAGKAAKAAAAPRSAAPRVASTHRNF